MHAPYQTRMLLSDVVVNEYSRLWIYLEKKQSIFTARRYASAVYAVVVSLSICLSVTRPYCTRTAKHRITPASRTTAHGF